MKTGASPSKFAAILAATGLLAGCSQTGSFVPRHTTLGSLKTSVSHLEFENDQLRHEVAKLKTENRDIEDRLSQEEDANGDLTARLDDARHELRRRGLDLDGESLNASRTTPEPSETPRTLPAGRSNRRPRKPPFAKIPGRLDTVPPADPADDDTFVTPKVKVDEDLGAQSYFPESDRWLPIARGTSASPSKVR